MSTPWDISLYDGDGVGRFTGEAVGEPSGGSSPVQLASVNLNSADLLALHDTPKTLLAAPTGREYHIVHGFVLHMRPGDTPYTVDALETWKLTVGYGAIEDIIEGEAGPFTSLGAADFPAATVDKYLYALGLVAANSDVIQAIYFEWDADAIEAQPVIMAGINYSSGDPIPLIDGNGTMTVRIWYSTIDGAP